MVMELDTTKLKQAGFRKTVSHDNCVVLDIGSGSFPRYIEVRPPGDDGSRMTAVWDGSLDLAVNDKVIAVEYGGNPIWRIQSKGGADSGTGSVRVSKVWESDFGAVALTADADGDIGIGTASPAGQLEINTTTATKNALILQSTDDDNTEKLLSAQIADGTEFLKINIALAALPTALTIDTTGVATATRSLPLTVVFDDDSTSLLSNLSGMVFANLNTTDNNNANIIFTGKTTTGAQPAFGALACQYTDHTNASKDADIILVSMRTNTMTEQLRIRSDGFLGLGVATGLMNGKIHAYDAISGFMHWKYDGLDGTSRTIISNGAGDVLYRLHIAYVLRDSAGAVASGTTDISNGGSVGLTVGANTVTIAVAGTGAVTVSRTAGTDTIKVGFWLLWL